MKLAYINKKHYAIVHSGLTVEQVREIWKRQDLVAKREADQVYHDPSKAENVEITEPVQKEIRVRLPQDKWCLIREEARKIVSALPSSP